MRFERIGAAATRLVVEIAPFDVIDDHAAIAGILTLYFHTFGQRFQLVGIKATWELHAQLLEEL